MIIAKSPIVATGITRYRPRTFSRGAPASIITPVGLFDWGGTAKTPLTITAPRAGMDANHRMLHAYPGLEYSIRVAAVGGVYPYLYEISNNPIGMSINPFTGAIVWTNPTVSAPNIVVRVTDTKGSSVTETFSITVGTSRFRFVDASAPNDLGTGLINSPWRTILGLFNNDAQNIITYFSSGVYNCDGLATQLSQTGTHTRTDIEHDGSAGRGHSTIWLARPGHSPAIDFQYSGITPAQPYIVFSGPCVYVDGFELYNEYAKCFEVRPFNSTSTPIFRRLNCHTGGPGEDGSNAGFLMSSSQGFAFSSYGMTIQDCIFGSAGHNALKIYSVDKHLIENCQFSANGGIEEKAWCKFTIRNNLFQNIVGAAIGGNLNNNEQVPPNLSTGETCFNRFMGATVSCLEYGRSRSGQIGPMWSYRNTYNGPLTVLNLMTEDGPYMYERDVIVNNDGGQLPFPFIQETSVSDPSRVSITASLAPTGMGCLAGSAADNIIDGGGLLQEPYRTARLYSWGHEIPN